DHRARTAGVAHVHALHGRLERERIDQPGVEARAEPPRARRGRDEVHIARRPPRPPEDGAHRGGADLDGAALEPVIELVDALVRREGLGIEVEVPAVDLAIGEEAGALPFVSGELQERGLIPAISRYSRGARGNPGRAHVAQHTLPPLALSTRAGHYRRRSP